ncbi:MAG: FAD-dependent oxidoreductase [Kiritimatiellae bacterium]|nr:FAD-dependent oxidoreductase [Kiritimatiellia bacterium]
MNVYKSWFVIAAFCWGSQLLAATMMVEAESFANKGGWVVDQQFVDQMGSSFLLAHGLGTPVADAVQKIEVPESGRYRVLARTRNWNAEWNKNEAAGRFQIIVNGKVCGGELGNRNSAWEWQEAGTVDLEKGAATIALHDLTGFDGRCDAVVLTSESSFTPPSKGEALEAFRYKMGTLKAPVGEQRFDLVVAGGGVAGICAAVSAARLGLKVALIQDRAVLGGNNSSEVRVHLGGQINLGPYPRLGDVVSEIGPAKGGNAKPPEFYEDQRKHAVVDAEKNITQFLNTRAVRVEMDGSKIKAVIGRHVESGAESRFAAPVFADCTGDGSVGVAAGAEYRHGREGRDEFNEPTAPEKSDSMTMGSSVQWYSVEEQTKAPFPDIKWGLDFNETKCERVKMGEWTWETGMNQHQIHEFERVRDYGMLVVMSNWSFLKNHSKDKEMYTGSKLDWVAYVAGKRESYRLVGDLLLTELDLINDKIYPDGTACTTWTVDLHYPDPKNTKNFPGTEFKSIAKHIPIYPYPIPYRCFYSRNVDNLFMAGRNISVTHVALGTTRVMRTTGMMGEVVGMAAAICVKNNCNPRGVYTDHLGELKALMQKGIGVGEQQPPQKYNTGGGKKRTTPVKL